MEAPVPRPLRPARIVALLLIAIAVSGLAYLHFAADKTVSVPKGAQAGSLRLHSCTYHTDGGSLPADCGTLVVPENRSDRQSRLIALPITRIHARSAHPGAPIFRLEGGPGRTNMKFSIADRYVANHDVVLVGYRGVDSSVRLDCPEVDSAMQHSSSLLGQKAFRAKFDAFRSCSKRLRHEGVDLAGYSLPQRVDDFETARKALRYGRVDLLSESAGTRTALIYGWRYPNSIHRSVMVGVNPPGNFVWTPQKTDELIRRYAALCKADAPCASKDGDVAAMLRSGAADVPSHWGILPIKEGNVRLASFFGLMNATSAAGPLSAPATLDAWHAADHGDASGLWFQSVLADLVFPTVQVWGDSAAVARTDAQTAERYFAPGSDRSGSILGDPGSQFLWSGGKLVDAWPATPDENEYAQVRDSNVETLLISGKLDLATPPQSATDELLPHLANGHQVLLDGMGHTDDFWGSQEQAGTHLVTTFLDTGKVDDSQYTHTAVDFAPETAQTKVAKILVGLMLAFAAITAVALLWLPRRVRRRGAFGVKASAFLRTVLPVVLGLGGWFVAILVVLTASIHTPINDELLTVLSVAIPVGLGIFWAWAPSDRASRTRMAGLVAAIGGAVIGGFLGFHATDGYVAPLTAIVGAGAGANLSLLVLDIVRDRAAGRPTREISGEVVEPHATHAVV